MRRHGRPAVGAAAAALILLVGTVVPAGAQRPPPDVPPPLPVDSPAPPPDTTGRVQAGETSADVPGPAGAFVRSLLVPGWGQAAFDAYFRGGVYFAARTGSTFMVVKTMEKLGEARDMERRRRAVARDSLLGLAETDSALAERFEDPAELEQAIEQDSAVVEAGDLTEARAEQREDWIAWLLFWTLVGGVDAYVTAHLSDFPVDVIAEPRAGGGARVGVRLRTGSWP
ncbi:MAG: DUF5683 domain-containing protein [Gemmatimonadota bacterium]